MELLEPLSQWPGAVLLRRSSLVYLLVNAAHILSIGLIIGSIVTLDLRLLGLFGPHPVSALGPALSRMASTGIWLAVLTGLALFTVRPVAYAQNTAFLIKLGLLAAALLNAWLVTRSESWRRALEDGRPSPALRLQAALSIALWAGAVIAGRWIGFL